MRMTANGYLVAQARVARTGIQIYHGDEVGDPNAPRCASTGPRRRSSTAARLHTFAHKPVTLGHPPGNGHRPQLEGLRRRPRRRRDRARRRHGQGPDDDHRRRRHRGHQQGRLAALGWLRRAAGDRRRQDRADGEPYDAVQHDIRVNHIALTPTARGGPKLRLGDKKGKQTMQRASPDPHCHHRRHRDSSCPSPTPPSCSAA